MLFPPGINIIPLKEMENVPNLRFDHKIVFLLEKLNKKVVSYNANVNSRELKWKYIHFTVEGASLRRIISAND